MIILSVPAKLNLSKSYVYEVPFPVALLVQLPLVVPVYTVPPRPATTRSLNIAQNIILSVDADTCGTMFVLNLVVPFILRYPPVMSGSKFVSCSASPGDMLYTSLFNTKPPAQLALNGDMVEVSGIYMYPCISHVCFAIYIFAS